MFPLSTVSKRKPTGQCLHSYPHGTNGQEAVRVVSLEAAAFVMTQAVVSRQPVGDMEILSCITLSNILKTLKVMEEV